MSPEDRGPEDRRQLVHASMTLFALALRWLTCEQAMALGGAAVALNWIVLPLTGLDRGLRREGAPWIDGVKLYPVAVLLLLVFVQPLPAAAAAWAVMGIGDAASNVIGRRLGRPPFLGRRDRSLAGTAAFVVCAFPAAAAAHGWVAYAMPGQEVLVAVAAATVAGAAAELLVPRGWDDNVAIAIAAGGAFLLVSG